MFSIIIAVYMVGYCVMLHKVVALIFLFLFHSHVFPYSHILSRINLLGLLSSLRSTTAF